MKTDVAQLIRDISVAIMLNQPEAIDLALNALLKLPGIASNDRMGEGIITQVILPVGEKLSGLPSHWLRPLLGHELAIGRAVGGVALVHRFVKDSDATQKDLHHAGSDHRPDVRLSLGKALIEGSKINPEKVFQLGVQWVSQPSPRLRQTALIFLPGLAERYLPQIAALLGTFGEEEDQEVKSALVAALTDLGRGGYAEQVLELLSTWSILKRPEDWVICQTLSSHWVTAYPFEVESILRELRSRVGDSKPIRNALKALERHGLYFDQNTDQP